MRDIIAYAQDQVAARAFKVGDIFEGNAASAYYARDNGTVCDVGGE